MARVLGQMRASTDPPSGANGLKERAHFGLIAGKRPGCERARRHSRMVRGPVVEGHGGKMLSTASQTRSSLASPPAFFRLQLASRPLPDANSGPLPALRDAKRQAALSA